ncbi:ABC transporter permease, partial [Achromobacter ruhlandii]|nr:ABC transporter permease [Achromobacter ruhlandii]
MNAWLRQHRYALMVTLRRLLKQPFSSLANLLV